MTPAAETLMTSNEAPPASRKRRWFRFRLRTLLVLMTLLCVWMGWLMVGVERQRRVVATLSKYNAELGFNPFTSSPPVYHWVPKWLHESIRLYLPNDYKRLTQVTIDSPELRAEDLAVLTDLPNLRLLSLTGLAVTDECMPYIADLKQIKVLKLIDTKVTDDGLKHLSGLTNLESLLIPGNRITDAGIVHLRSLSKVDSLYLDGIDVTGACIRSLAELDALRVVMLSNTAVCGPDLALLARLSKLELVVLHNTPVSDADLPYLKQIPSHVGLWLGGTKLSDEAHRQLPNARDSRRQPAAAPAIVEE